MLDGILTREWDAAWDAFVHLVLPGDRAGHDPAGDHRADHPRLGRGGAARGLRAHRRGQGPARRRTISRRHVLRNALLPVVTTIGLQAGLLFSGAVLTETVFAFNGIGQYLFEAIGQRDYPVLQGFIIFIAIIYSLINLLVDVLLRLHRPESEGVDERCHDPAGGRLRRPTSRAATSPRRRPLARRLPPAAPQPHGDRRRADRAGVLVVVAVFAPLLTPYEPGSAEWAGQVTPSSVPGPVEDHWLGLDRFGSDMWTQMVFGARQSLVYGVVSTAIGLAVGARWAPSPAASGIGGRFGGWVDTAIMRLVDIMLSIPSLLLAVSIAAVLGQNAYVGR